MQDRKHQRIFFRVHESAVGNALLGFLHLRHNCLQSESVEWHTQSPVIFKWFCWLFWRWTNRWFGFSDRLMVTWWWLISGISELASLLVGRHQHLRCHCPRVSGLQRLLRPSRHGRPSKRRVHHPAKRRGRNGRVRAARGFADGWRLKKKRVGGIFFCWWSLSPEAIFTIFLVQNHVGGIES